jgi:hypothetical protein
MRAWNIVEHIIHNRFTPKSVRWTLNGMTWVTKDEDFPHTKRSAGIDAWG